MELSDQAKAEIKAATDRAKAEAVAEIVICPVVHAMKNYFASLQAYDAAIEDFNKACRDVRAAAKSPSKFVYSEDGKSYLVSIDAFGAFDVSPIDVLLGE